MSVSHRRRAWPSRENIDEVLPGKLEAHFRRLAERDLLFRLSRVVGGGSAYSLLICASSWSTTSIVARSATESEG